MKRLTILLSSFLVLNVGAMMDLEARPGEGGARGSGGGAPRGGGIQRSPSMSRAANPQFRNAPASRPQANRSDVSRSSLEAQRAALNTPRTSQNTETRGQVQQFMQKHPTASPGQRPVSRPGNQIGNGGNVGQNRLNIGNNLRINVGQYQPNRRNWFNNNFWDNHHNRPPYYGYGGNWWAPATALGVGAWFGWQNQPYYYGSADDWGPGYSDDYDGGSSSPNYHSYTNNDVQQNLTTEVAPAPSANDQWMPLGVFAITQMTGSVAPPNTYIQLAVNKQGLISGTYYNTTLDQALELEGLVDPTTQRAAWKLADNENSPVVETGIYNLTLPETAVRLYYPNGQTQDHLLVRLEQPQ